MSISGMSSFASSSNRSVNRVAIGTYSYGRTGSVRSPQIQWAYTRRWSASRSLSIHNTIERIDKDLLALHLRVYAHWIWGLLTEPVLPYEYVPIATRFTDRLEELAKLDIPDIDMAAAVQQAREFQELAQTFDAQARLWRQRIGGGAADGHPADLLNSAMIQLSRILVPIASTVVGAYGQ